MVFQDNVLYPHLTVADNIGFALRLAKVDKHEVDRRVTEIARIAATQRRAPPVTRPNCPAVSRGEIAAMGRAIVRTPRLLLMDEPMSNLDAKLRTETAVRDPRPAPAASG